MGGRFTAELAEQAGGQIAEAAESGAQAMSEKLLGKVADTEEANLEGTLAKNSQIASDMNAMNPDNAVTQDAGQVSGDAAGGAGAGSGGGAVSGGDVTDAGVGSGGVGSAETGTTDPVDVVSGQLLESVIDFSLPGVLPLVLRRAYASGYVHGGLLGPGWSCTLDIRLLVDSGGAVRFLDDDAQILDYGVPSGLRLGLAAYPSYGARWALNLDEDGALTVTNPRAGITYRFAAGGAVRPLTKITDRNGNAISILRDANGLPTGIEHSGGYRLAPTLTETAAGTRLTGYVLAPGDGAGGPVRVVGFDYDEAGRLVRVLDASDAAYCYEWDTRDRICAWIDKSGYRYLYQFDADGRCVETGEAGGFKHARLTYDTAARITRVTDALGHTTTYHYNRLQQVTKILDPLGAETVLDKDLHGNVLTHTSPLGHTTRFEYDQQGDRTSITWADGTRATLAYHGPGLVSRIQLPDGAVWHYTYDTVGNLVGETDPLGAVTRFTYDEHGGVREVIDPLGSIQGYENNRVGLPLVAISPAGERTAIERDGHGRIARITAPDGAATAYTRDAQGRVLAETGPDGGATVYTYDLAGNLACSTDPSGATSRFEYGPFYRPTARVNPDGARYEFGYDGELRLATVTGPTGLSWSYRYNAAGERVEERDFDGRVLAYDYDADGRLIERTASDGAVTTYTRDTAGRLLEVRCGEQASRFAYDPAGRLARAHNAHAAIEITRDLAGQPIREQVNDRTLTRSFDAAGRLIERTTPAGVVSQWAYDINGEASSLTAGTDAISFTRDQLGREIRRELGPNAALTHTYDTAGHISSQQILGAGQIVQERAYGYDADGIPVHIADRLRGIRELHNDRAGRVTTVSGANWTETYAYDQLGNLTDTRLPEPVQDTDAADAAGPRTLTGTRIERAGRTNYTYDANGRLTAKSRKTLSGQNLAWNYTWDGEDRLTAATLPDHSTWTYRYDPLGRRIAKSRLDAGGEETDTVEFTWDGARLIEQSTPREDGTTLTLTWDYEPASHRPAVQRRTLTPAPNRPGPLETGQAAHTGRESDQGRIDAEFWAIVTDITGTPQELVTRDGSLAWAQRTLLWGRRTESALPTGTGGPGCPLGFPGQYHDAETGLDYNNQRYYDPDTATYLSPDPQGLAAAPNPRRYVPNPLTAIDPLGLTPQSPSVPLKTDEELQADADAIYAGFGEPGTPAYDRKTVSAYQGDDGNLYYSVSSNKTAPNVEDIAEQLGYKRIFGKKFTAENSTDAEQIMLNALDQGAVHDAGRIATSRIPCGEYRRTGLPAQNCGARIASYAPKIRLVGRFATG